MQDDITDGVNWLIDEGIADPDRIAIYGASYGENVNPANVA
jgi:dipeptidyl aminopeptidase/acylaminoacyl peptidase